MNRDRLEHAKRVIEHLRDAGVADAKKEGQDVLRMGDWGHAKNCGTIACLGGWFTLDPHFRAQGLKNARDTTPNTTSLVPCYQASTAYSALALFFDISLQQPEHLFSSSNPGSFRHALVRFDQVLAGSDDWDDFMATRRRQKREWEQETEFAHD